MSAPDPPAGLVLGHQAASSQTFAVGLAQGQSLEVDDLVAVTTEDPGGDVTTFGIVAESYAALEGASLPSDTATITTSAASRPAAVSPSVTATPPVVRGSAATASPRARRLFTPSVVRPARTRIPVTRARPMSGASWRGVNPAP